MIQTWGNGLEAKYVPGTPIAHSWRIGESNPRPPAWIIAIKFIVSMQNSGPFSEFRWADISVNDERCCRCLCCIPQGEKNLR
jgi:hypothetical protein